MDEFRHVPWECPRCGTSGVVDLNALGALGVVRCTCGTTSRPLLTSVLSLPDFLLARYADRADPGRYGGDLNSGYIVGLHLRLLADIEAKRRIVERYVDVKAYVDQGNHDDEYAAELSGLETALEYLTRPYVDHPDWREEWRV